MIYHGNSVHVLRRKRYIVEKKYIQYNLYKYYNYGTFILYKTGEI